MNYNHQEIEKKWQDYWALHGIFKAKILPNKPKYYVLDMFPYPSGSGLHVGHPLGYIASDIYSRYKRHQGYNVLHPMGYDSFGLPAEQYAIQTGLHPALTTKENIKRYRKQLDRMGFSFDWDREVRTSDPSYYKWTQWIFTELFNSWYDASSDCAKPIDTLICIFEEKGNFSVNASCDKNIFSFSSEEWMLFSEGKKDDILLKYRLAFLSNTEVNWCEALGTVLANDEIINGVSERGGHPVIRKKMKQWSLRITAYADRLLQGLETIDWSESLKEAQRHWIGKSIGVLVKFDLESNREQIKVFTTRVDTIFGVTFLTLAPESRLSLEVTTSDRRNEVKDYLEKSAKRSDIERMAEHKNISGIFTGQYAIHPLTGDKIPIWIGDYVLEGYGTGAVMGVPSGDQRDYDFAKYFNIPIKNIFDGADISKKAFTDKQKVKLTNSGKFNNLNQEEATKQITKTLEGNNYGTIKINYRLRDAVFSRQRYWGEPFPVYYKNNSPKIIEKKYLPIILPKVENYLPTKAGKPPLGNARKWAWDTQTHKIVDSKLIDQRRVYPMELNTMPGWAGSSWYFNRYMDALNDQEFVSKDALNYWKDVDLYIGGSEHATGHLLYSRFWQNFLYDRGFLPVKEYAKRLLNQGMILGESAIIYRDSQKNIYYSANQSKDKNATPIRVDIAFLLSSNTLSIKKLKGSSSQYKDATFVSESNGTFLVDREVEKMSKSKYNVVNPDNICEKYGADTLRLYEMFLGPIEQAKPWSTSGINGVYSFLKKFWKLYLNENGLYVDDSAPSQESLETLHKTIKKITEDIENFSFNTSISALMICVNELTSQKCRSLEILSPLAVLISPFAPHIAEEIWCLLGHHESISTVKYPKYEASYLIKNTKEYPVSFNGKMRFKVTYDLDIPIPDIQKNILTHSKTKEYIGSKNILKVIVVPNKIINIVTS